MRNLALMNVELLLVVLVTPICSLAIIKMNDCHHNRSCLFEELIHLVIPLSSYQNEM